MVENCPKVIRSISQTTHSTILLVYLLLGASSKNVFDNFKRFDDPHKKTLLNVMGVYSCSRVNKIIIII